MSRIEKLFEDKCVSSGGKVLKDEYFGLIMCKFENTDEKDYINFIKWMKNTVFKNRDKMSVRELSAEYISDIMPPFKTSYFSINKKRNKMKLNMTAYKRIHYKDIMNFLKEKIDEKFKNMDETVKASIIHASIDNWYEKFPKVVDDTDTDLWWDDEFDEWVIEASDGKDITEKDNINTIFNHLNKKTIKALEKTPQPKLLAKIR